MDLLEKINRINKWSTIIYMAIAAVLLLIAIINYEAFNVVATIIVILGVLYVIEGFVFMLIAYCKKKKDEED